MVLCAAPPRARALPLETCAAGRRFVATLEGSIYQGPCEREIGGAEAADVIFMDTRANPERTNDKERGKQSLIVLK